MQISTAQILTYLYMLNTAYASWFETTTEIDKWAYKSLWLYEALKGFSLLPEESRI